MHHQITLQFIDAIARAGSIRRAAAKMAITPSALNRRLLAVEEEIDAQLFERNSSGVRLSAAGELFIAHARRQIADMERVRSQIEDLKGARRGHIRIAFDAELSNSGEISEAVGLYRAEHPEVSFQLESTPRETIMHELISYNVDLAVALQPKSHPNLTTLATAPLAVVAILRPDHPLAHKKNLTFNDVFYHPLILPAHGPLRQVLDAAARRQDYDLRPVMECALGFARHSLENSDTIGFGIDTLVSPKNDLAGLRAIPISMRDVPQLHIHLIQLRGRTLSVATGRFADMVTQRFAGYSGEV